MDNVGSLRYSGRLFHTIGPDAVKERRPYVDSLTGGTMYATYRQTDVKRQTASSLNAPWAGV